MIVFRHADPRFPFMWESADQPPARWHDVGEGPVQYFSTTADAAWAEFLRHEEIRDPADLAGVERGMWTVEISEPPQARPRLSAEQLTGDQATYEACRAEARRLRERGASGVIALSAAVDQQAGSGFRTDGGLRRARRRTESVVVLFGRRPDLVGWAACASGRPRDDLLPRVRHFAA